MKFYSVVVPGEIPGRECPPMFCGFRGGCPTESEESLL